VPNIRETENSLRRTVQEAKARLKVIEAKDELRMAQNAIEADDLSGAEARVESALNLLEEARSLTADHTDAVTEVQQTAREILAAIRAKANTSKADLDSLMERSDCLLRIMKESATAPFKDAA
jgi:thioredoxin-like negative regulator of GroEL